MVEENPLNNVTGLKEIKPLEKIKEIDQTNPKNVIRKIKGNSIWDHGEPSFVGGIQIYDINFDPDYKKIFDAQIADIDERVKTFELPPSSVTVTVDHLEEIKQKELGCITQRDIDYSDEVYGKIPNIGGFNLGSRLRIKTLENKVGIKREGFCEQTKYYVEKQRISIKNRSFEQYLEDEIMKEGGLGVVVVGNGTILGGIGYERYGRLMWNRFGDAISTDKNLDDWLKTDPVMYDFKQIQDQLVFPTLLFKDEREYLQEVSVRMEVASKHNYLANK